MDFLLPLAALLALLVGPLFWHFSTQSDALGSAVDGFAIVAVGGLTLLLIAPGAIAGGGLIALVLMGVGLVLPRLLHQLGPARAGMRADRVLLAGLVIHATIESAALAASSDGSHLGLAIVAHRVPVGLAIFMLAPNNRDGWIAIGIIVLASVLGYAGGYNVNELSPQSHAWLDGFVAGSLLHVIQGHHAGHNHGPACDHPQKSATSPYAESEPGHSHAHEVTSEHDHTDPSHTHASTPDSVYGAIGALSGAAVLAAAVIEPHGHHHLEAGDSGVLDQFVTLALISAPALLVGYLLAGLIGVVLGERTARWLGSGNRISQAGKGLVFGLPMPICSCGVLPVYESLLRRGAAPAAGLAFLVATPEIGIDALAISLPLLGTELTVVRLLAAFVVALSVALVLAGSATKPQVIEAEKTVNSMPFKSRMVGGLRFGLVELFDHTMPWVFVGLALAALLAPALETFDLASLPAVLQVPVFTLMAIPAYVCASGATPIAAVALQAGLSPGAAMAFLIAGPATNVTTFGILSRLHGPGFALKFGVVMAMAAMVVGWLINQRDFVLPELALNDVHSHASLLQITCLVILLILALASLFRQGPRGLLAQVIAPFKA
ncbi:MAG: permease [Lysobacterales bacterium]